MVEMVVFEEWGKILSAMNERLVKEYVESSRKIGKTKFRISHEGKFLNKSIEHLSELRNNLEEVMFQQHKESTTHVFYGRPHERE